MTINKIKLIWIALALPALAILFIIAWIIIGTYKADHTDEIAKAILFGQFDEQDYQTNYRSRNDQNYAVLNAAINTRFPKGSSPENVKAFFEKIGSTCEFRPNKSIFCHLPESASFCVSFWIDITINVETDGNVQNIVAKPNALGC